jgi:hypothetical protein
VDLLGDSGDLKRLGHSKTVGKYLDKHRNVLQKNESVCSVQGFFNHNLLFESFNRSTGAI